MSTAGLIFSGLSIYAAYTALKKYFSDRQQRLALLNPFASNFTPRNMDNTIVDCPNANQFSVAGVSIQQKIARVRAKLRMDNENTANIAVCGNSGTGKFNDSDSKNSRSMCFLTVGKSTFINCIRGLPDVEMKHGFIHIEDGPAPVGIMDTTMEPMKYRWPQNTVPCVTLWDLPVVRSMASVNTDYFEEQGLYAFDCLLLLRAGRFTQFDLLICNRAHQYKIPVVLVITKGDQDVESNRKIKRRQLGRQLTAEEDEQVISKTKAMLKENATAELSAIRSRSTNTLVEIPPIFVVAPQSYRDQLNGVLDLGGCPPLETTQLTEHFLTAIVNYRSQTTGDNDKTN
ncbi:unnamed protein product [Rotaria socialis]|nr:unnamed protein product [Rotaria socialis]